MSPGGEAIGFAFGAVIVVAAIYAFDWVQRNCADAIDEQLRVETDPWGDVIELPDAAKSGGRRRAAPGSHKGHEIAPHSERGL